MTWPGIPDGKGSTCAEEGCGGKRRARGNDCRECYRRKWMQHKRASGDLTDGKGGYEVELSPVVIRDLDRFAHDEWRRRQDEFT